MSTNENVTDTATAAKLKSLVERIERLTEEKTGLSDDIKDVFLEAKAAGFETKIMKKVLRLRKMDRDKRMEEESLTELYKSALGME